MITFMDEIAKNYANSNSTATKRSDAALRARKSYHLNQIKVYRRRILNSIAKGHCVLEKTLHDPKYQWNDSEKAMLQRCLDIRRNRYIIPSEHINVIRDKRYMRAARELAIMQTIKQKINKVLTNTDTNDNTKQFLQEDIIPYINENIKLYNITNKPVINNNTKQPFGRDSSNSQLSNRTSEQDDLLLVNNSYRSSSSDASKSSDSSHKNTSQQLITTSVLSMDDVIQAYDYLVDADFFYPNRNREHKSRGKNKYKNTIIRMFKRFVDFNPQFNNDLMHVYRNPKQYLQLTQNYSDALRIIYKLHLLSKQNKFPLSKVSNSVYNLGKTIKTTESFTKQYTLLQKRAQNRLEHNRDNAPYYDWEEIKKIIGLVRGNSITAQRDRIIMSIYIHENVVRDNLGLVYFFENKRVFKSDNFEIDGYNIDQIDYIYKSSKTKQYKVILNTYKNESFRGDFTIEISKRTSELIDVYINTLKKTFPNRRIKYLITKNDGEPYKDGKLSDYIIRMFKKYTMNKAINLGINELRHSVATYYKNESDDFKATLAYKMQHTLKTHHYYERVSDRVIKLFDDSIDSQINPFDERPIKLLYNKKLVHGIIKQTNQIDKYDVVFSSDSNIPTMTYDSSVIALMLENQDVSLNIGKKVEMTVSDDDLSLYGEKVVTGLIGLNKDYTWDVEDDNPSPAYVFIFDDDRFNNLEKKIEFDLPHPKIKLI